MRLRSSSRRSASSSAGPSARCSVSGAPVGRSRLAMLAGRSDEALEVGVEALELARQFGDERLEARALVTNGAAKAHLGGSGTAELERGIELAERANAMTEYVRGTNNLAQEFLVVRDLASTGELYDIALERLDRPGLKSAT